jgi:hypothetical protein
MPFPLELVALCMLRVIVRKDHEGRLDASEREGRKEGRKRE